MLLREVSSGGWCRHGQRRSLWSGPLRREERRPEETPLQIPPSAHHKFSSETFSSGPAPLPSSDVATGCFTFRSESQLSLQSDGSAHGGMPPLSSQK